MDKVNIYEWETQIIVYATEQVRNKLVYQILSELHECGFKDVHYLGGNKIYATGLESNWADMILTRPDLYDYITKPRRIYLDSVED